MRAACEELRVGIGDGGRLFRKAMMKTGLWGHGAVPIEYSVKDGMVDWIGGEAARGGRAKGVWDSDWKRG
jgi:large subunit ribosomal protein L40